MTRDHQVDSSKCNGAPECWAYFGSLDDNGSFVTVDGKPSPAGSGTVHGVHSGTMQGVAKFSFYSSFGSPSAALIPTSATKATSTLTTSTWFKAAMPDWARVFDAKLVAYSWTYANDLCEKWVDSINPGDDGQNAALDGDILNINHCNAG